LTSTVQNEYCPYSSKIFNEIVTGDANLSRGKILQDSSTLLQKCHLADYANTLNKINTNMLNNILEMKEHDDIKQTNSSNYPNISINVVDTDNACVCMCTSLSCKEYYNKYTTKTTRNIGPICHNLKKVSISNTTTEQIIVNRNDMLHFNTYIENENIDPYTPESNESHSPYPEMRSTSKTTSSNSCNHLDNTNCDQKILLHGQTGIEDLVCLKSVKALSEKQSRVTVTPVQLKSRLENLQRISLHSADRDDLTDRNDDADNAKPICSSKTFSNSQNPNPSNFFMCCSIH